MPKVLKYLAKTKQRAADKAAKGTNSRQLLITYYHDPSDDILLVVNVTSSWPYASTSSKVRLHSTILHSSPYTAPFFRFKRGGLLSHPFSRSPQVLANEDLSWVAPDFLKAAEFIEVSQRIVALHSKLKNPSLITCAAPCIFVLYVLLALFSSPISLLL